MDDGISIGRIIFQKSKRKSNVIWIQNEKSRIQMTVDDGDILRLIEWLAKNG